MESVEFVGKQCGIIPQKSGEWPVGKFLLARFWHAWVHKKAASWRVRQLFEGVRACPYVGPGLFSVKGRGAGLVQLDQLILLASHAQRFGVVQRVHAVARIDALNQVDFSVVL